MLEKALSAIFVAEGTEISDKDEQPSKAFVAIDVTDAGIDISSNELHPSKEDSPIVVTVFGKIIFFKVVLFLNKLLGMDSMSPDIVNDVQPLKALFPIWVRDEEIVISIKDVHCSNVESPRLLTVGGSTILVNVVQFLNELFGIFSILPDIVKIVHPSNALLPIDVTDEGIDTSFNDLQFSNDDSPMVVTVGENVIFVKVEFSLK